MDTAFSQTIAGWHEFYLLLGTAEATLVGLLFVAVSLHLDVLTQPNQAEARTLAFTTFITFISLLLFALYFLIPAIDPPSLAASLFFTAVFCLGRLLVRTTNFTQSVSRLWSNRFLFWRVVVPGLCYLGIIVIALTVLAGQTSYLYWLVAVFAVLTVVAARNAWDLLLQVGADKQALRETGAGDPQLHRVEKALREVTRRQRQITRQQEDAARNGAPGVPPPRRRG